MKKEYININNLPAIIWGDTSNSVYFYVHGQHGSKEEANFFSEIANSLGWQVLSIDLPGHGERVSERDGFVPWEIVPELRTIMSYITTHWDKVSLYANSIGVYVSMLACCDMTFTRCLFVSPILNMEKLIYTMMRWAKVEEAQLKEKGMIQTDFGQTLSWEYLTYVKKHPITNWKHSTYILYGLQDTMSERTTVEDFAKQFACQLHVEEKAPHWFQTSEQLQTLRAWERAHCEKEIL